MQSLHRVEKSPPSDGTGDIGAGDLSTQSIIKAFSICFPYRHAAPLEMTMVASTIGHAFGVRVDGPLARGLWPPVGGGLCIASLRGRQRLCRCGWWWRPLGADFKKRGAAGAGVFGRQDAVKKKPLISRSFFFISAEIRIHSSGIRPRGRRNPYGYQPLHRMHIQHGVLHSAEE